jgi:RimJ/RimL family protein N-acetyltransferase
MTPDEGARTAVLVPPGVLPRLSSMANDRPILRTARLVLEPMESLHEAEHAAASGRAADAGRDTRAADAQWRAHRFGPWSIRDGGDNSFLGGAELRFAGDGIDGIAPDEIEAGWWVTERRRGEGIATEAMCAAIDDVWHRTGAGHIAAYIGGVNEPSHRVAAKLGFIVRGEGRGRSGEAMTVYELRRPH